MSRPAASRDGSWRRRRVVPAAAALLLAVGGVVEFGLEDRIIWLAVIFWLLAGTAVVIGTSVAAPRAHRDLGR